MNEQDIATQTTEFNSSKPETWACDGLETRRHEALMFSRVCGPYLSQTFCILTLLIDFIKKKRKEKEQRDLVNDSKT